MRPQRSGSHETPSEAPCKAEVTSPPPMLRPPVPSRFTAGRSAALASSTYCAACSTRVAVTRKSGLLAIASTTSASSCGSPKVASQLSWMAPAGAAAGAAFHLLSSVRVLTTPACARISSGVGGSLVIQPASNTTPAREPRMILGDCMSASVEFQDQPIELGADADDDLADDVDHVRLLGVDRPGAVRAGREEDFLVLTIGQQPHRQAVGRDRCDAAGAVHAADGQLALRGGP